MSVADEQGPTPVTDGLRDLQKQLTADLKAHQCEELQDFFIDRVTSGLQQVAARSTCNGLCLGTSGVGKTQLIAAVCPLGSEQRKAAIEKVSHDEAGLHAFGEPYVAKLHGLTIYDSPGIEQGQDIREYLTRMLGRLYSPASNLESSIDVAWYVDKYPPSRLELPAAKEIFQALKNARIPTIIVITMADLMAYDPAERQYQQDQVRVTVHKLMKIYPNIMELVFVSTKPKFVPGHIGPLTPLLLKHEPADLASVRHLLDTTAQYLEEGALMAFTRALMVESSNMCGQSADAIMACMRKRDLALMLFQPIPGAELVLMKVLLDKCFGAIYAAWNVPKACKKRINQQLVSNHTYQGLGGWAAFKAGAWGLAVLVNPAFLVLSAADAPVMVQLRVRLGLMVTGVVSRLRVLTGGNFDLPDDHLTEKVDEALAHYRKVWEEDVQSFCLHEVSVLNLLEADSRAKLRSKIVVFLSQHMTL